MYTDGEVKVLLQKANDKFAEKLGAASEQEYVDQLPQSSFREALVERDELRTRAAELECTLDALDGIGSTTAAADAAYDDRDIDMRGGATWHLRCGAAAVRMVSRTLV